MKENVEFSREIDKAARRMLASWTKQRDPEDRHSLDCIQNDNSQTHEARQGTADRKRVRLRMNASDFFSMQEESRRRRID